MNNGTGSNGYGKAIKLGLYSGLLVTFDVSYYLTKMQGENIDLGDGLLLGSTLFLAGGLGEKCLSSIRDVYRNRKSKKLVKMLPVIQ